MLQSKLDSPMQDAKIPHPTKAYGTLTIDEAIRSLGYTIKSRPEGGEPIWERNGYEFTQSRVIEREKLERKR